MRRTGPSTSTAGPRPLPADRPLQLSADDPDGPQVICQAWLDEVCVRHREIAGHAPAGAPRVADEKRLARVVVAHRQHGVTADGSFTGSWHRYGSGFRHSG